MAVDLSRLRGGNARDRRPWHGAAFIMESLVLLVFLVASLAVIMQLMGGAHERGTDADELSNAVVLASNDAEAFAADPTNGNRTATFSLVNDELVELADVGDTATAHRYDVTRTVQQHDESAGTLYEARIEVACDGRVVYGIDTSRYVSNEGGGR